MSKNISKSGYGELAAYLLIVTLCTAIVFVTENPILYFPMLAVASAFFGTAMHRGGQGLGITYFVAVAVVLFLLTEDVWQCIVYASVFLPAGTAFFIGLSGKRPFNSFVASGFLATSLMLASAVCVFVFENSDPFSFDIALSPVFVGIKEVIGASFDFVTGGGDALLLGLTRSAYVSAVFSQLLLTAPVMYALCLLGSLLLGFVISRGLYSAKFGKDPETLKYFGKIRDLRISVAGGVAFLVANIVYIFCDAAGFTAFFLSIFVSVMNYVFAAEGVAVLMSFMSLKEVKKPLRVITCIVSVLLCTTVISNLFSLLGLFDCFYNVRVRMSGKGGKKL